MANTVEFAVPKSFRPDDLDIQKNPYLFYPHLRHEQPVLKTSMFGRPCFVLSRRADISRVLMDPKTFSSNTTPLPALLFADPPEHERLRKMVAARFSRTAVQPLLPSVNALAKELLDAGLAAGGCDVVGELGAPLTITLISRLLGILPTYVEQLRDLTTLQSSYIMSIRLGIEPSEEERAAFDLADTLLNGIMARHEYDAYGIVALVVELVASNDMTLQQGIVLISLLFIAGHTTTTNLISNSCYILSQHTEYLERIFKDPEFINPFLEEVLRTRPSFQRIQRITTREVEIDGTTIPANMLVLLLLGSANRDEETFADAERFNPDAGHRAHFAFGQGIHTCLGAWLSRLEASAMLRLLAQRVCKIELDPSEPPVPSAGGTLAEFGFDRLVMRFTPRPDRPPAA